VGGMCISYLIVGGVADWPMILMTEKLEMQANGCHNPL
jgi:hypothetical protein